MTTILICIIYDLGDKVMHKLRSAIDCYLCVLFCLLSFEHFPAKCKSIISEEMGVLFDEICDWEASVNFCTTGCTYSTWILLAMRSCITAELILLISTSFVVIIEIQQNSHLCVLFKLP